MQNADMYFDFSELKNFLILNTFGYSVRKQPICLLLAAIAPSETISAGIKTAKTVRIKGAK